MNAQYFRLKVLLYVIGHIICMTFFALSIQKDFDDTKTTFQIIISSFFAIILLNALVLTPNGLRRRYTTTFANQNLKKRILLSLSLVPPLYCSLIIYLCRRSKLNKSGPPVYFTKFSYLILVITTINVLTVLNRPMFSWAVNPTISTLHKIGKISEHSISKGHSSISLEEYVLKKWSKFGFLSTFGSSVLFNQAYCSIEEQ
jgi:hypothetical protein